MARVGCHARRGRDCQEAVCCTACVCEARRAPPRMAASGDSDSLFEGDAFITSIEVSAGTEDNVQVSATLEFTGAITYADDTV